MPKKYLLLIVGASVTAVSAVAAATVVRRTRTEPPPVSATVPRVEDLGPAEGTVTGSDAPGDADRAATAPGETR